MVVARFRFKFWTNNLQHFLRLIDSLGLELKLSCYTRVFKIFRSINTYRSTGHISRSYNLIEKTDVLKLDSSQDP